MLDTRFLLNKDSELHAILGVCLQDVMLDERPRVFGTEFPTATGTAETDLAIEVHFWTTASWAVYVLVFRLDHHTCLSLKNANCAFLYI